jgi:hypothetical protein
MSSNNNRPYDGTSKDFIWPHYINTTSDPHSPFVLKGGHYAHPKPKTRLGATARRMPHQAKSTKPSAQTSSTSIQSSLSKQVSWLLDLYTMELKNDNLLPKTANVDDIKSASAQLFYKRFKHSEKGDFKRSANHFDTGKPIGHKKVKTDHGVDRD